MRRTVIPTLVAAAATLLAAACSGQPGGTGAPANTPGNTQGDSNKQLFVGISNQGLSVTFPAAIGRGIEDEAKKLGVKVVQLDANFDAAKQANDVQDLLTQKPDGILLIPVNAAESAQLVNNINTAGVPVASVHGQVGANRKPADVYPKLEFLYIEDEVAAGGEAGKLALEAVPQGGKVAIIEGQAGFAEVALREQDFKSTILKSGQFQIVATQPGDWTLQKGEAACQNVLAAHPDIALVYAESDDMAVGCTKAITATKSKAKVIGIGGSKTGIDAIKAGTMYGTVCYKPYTEGQKAMEEFYRTLRGEVTDKAKFITYPTPAITKANVDQCTPQW